MNWTVKVGYRHPCKWIGVSPNESNGIRSLGSLPNSSSLAKASLLNWKSLVFKLVLQSCLCEAYNVRCLTFFVDKVQEFLLLPIRLAALNIHAEYSNELSLVQSTLSWLMNDSFDFVPSVSLYLLLPVLYEVLSLGFKYLSPFFRVELFFKFKFLRDLRIKLSYWGIQIWILRGNLREGVVLKVQTLFLHAPNDGVQILFWTLLPLFLLFHIALSRGNYLELAWTVLRHDRVLALGRVLLFVRKKSLLFSSVLLL